mmetsp:Transcript_61785/g.147106  ORF Transcript_61785/g.147106 Transcript_61785/m.147106 type:complete len:307 (+) Transcript_61785:130-1050(+)
MGGMSEVNFDEEFQRIQQALQKRLFKKVDYAGSTSELLELGAALKREGSAPYAALCLMAAAQCQRSLEAPLKAAHHSVEAAQLLLSEELHMEELTPAAFREHAAAAVHCYLAAIQSYLSSSRFALASALYTEVASHLAGLGNAADAALYLDKAAQLVERDTPVVAEALILQGAERRVEAADWGGALEALAWLADVSQRRIARLSSKVGEMERAHLSIANALLAQALVRVVLGEWAAAREMMASLQTHAAAQLPTREVHTVWIPLLTAFIDAAQAQARDEAEELEAALTELVTLPLHRTLLARCVPR